MKRVRLILKNYRCFSDEEPLRIELGPGFEAIVGANNSGKSAIKLFFYEIRRFLSILTNPFNSSPSLASALAGQTIANAYEGVSDPITIFTNTNSRPLSIDIELLEPEIRTASAGDCLARLVATSERTRPQEWRFIGAYGRTNHLTNLIQGSVQLQSDFPALLSLHDGLRLDCSDFLEVCATLRDARYYGAFRNAINEGAGAHYDIRVGTDFINLWNGWKTSGVKSQMDAIQAVTNDLKRLFGFGALEINASKSLNTLIVVIDGKSYKLDELGSGLAQFIIVLGNAATNPAPLILIDEPETHLHPSLQLDFLLSLGRHAQVGVFFSTHSIGLARSAAEQIYSARKVDGKTVVRPLENTPDYLQFVGELSFSTFKELGSDRLFLVEGVNDVKAAQQLLRLVNKEHTTVILPLGGDGLASGGREAELHELTRLSNHIYALVDSEREHDAAEPAERRAQFAETCKKLRIDALVTKRLAFENYFTDRAVKSALGEAFSGLGEYELLKNAARPWGKHDNWKIARQMTLAELDGTDLGEFIKRL